jgi:hypothetical protein
MAKSCVFCGSEGPLTKEHTFADWLSKIGLDLQPRRHGAGPLNRSLQDRGVTRPFTQTVRDVCRSCNGGWMGALEAAAGRVLPQLILGQPGSIETEQDCAAIARWTHKTALVNMLVVPGVDQARGPLASEFRELWETRDSTPLARTTFWIGRYQGTDRTATAWLTPMTVTVEGVPTPERPQGYVMTLVVGQVLLQGIRFTTPLLEFEVRSRHGFAQLWPRPAPVSWPAGSPVMDDEFDEVGKGRHLLPVDSRIELRPWKRAVDLPDSEDEGDLVRLATPCGDHHHVYYPRVLVEAGVRGVWHAFLTSCECGKVYLVFTESGGAHFRAEGEETDSSIEWVVQRYEELEGAELVLETAEGEFTCKRLSRVGARSGPP